MRIRVMISIYILTTFIVILHKYSFSLVDYIELDETGKKTIETFYAAYCKVDCDDIMKIIEFKDEDQKTEIQKYCENNKVHMLWGVYKGASHIILPKCMVDNKGNVHALMLFNRDDYYEPLDIKLNSKMDKIVIRDDSILFWRGFDDPKWGVSRSEVYRNIYVKKKARINSMDKKTLGNYLQEQVIEMRLKKAALTFLMENKGVGLLGYDEGYVNDFLESAKTMSDEERKAHEISMLDRSIDKYTEKGERAKEIKEQKDAKKLEDEKETNNQE